MLGSITPLGERSRGANWASTVAWYLVGSTAGGAGVGWMAGWMGRATAEAFGMPGRSALLVLAAVVLTGVLLDAGPFGVTLPTVRRQVNEDWLQQYRGWVYGLGFGFQLGLGAATVVTISSVYAVPAAAFLSGSMSMGIAIGAAFGLVRGSTVLAASGVDRTDQLVRVDAGLRRWDRLSRQLAIALELGLAAMASLMALVPR